MKKSYFHLSFIIIYLSTLSGLEGFENPDADAKNSFECLKRVIDCVKILTLAVVELELDINIETNSSVSRMQDKYLDGKFVSEFGCQGDLSLCKTSTIEILEDALQVKFSVSCFSTRKKSISHHHVPRRHCDEWDSFDVYLHCNEVDGSAQQLLPNDALWSQDRCREGKSSLDKCDSKCNWQYKSKCSSGIVKRQTNPRVPDPIKDPLGYRRYIERFRGNKRYNRCRPKRTTTERPTTTTGTGQTTPPTTTGTGPTTPTTTPPTTTGTGPTTPTTTPPTTTGTGPTTPTTPPTTTGTGPTTPTTTPPTTTGNGPTTPTTTPPTTTGNGPTTPTTTPPTTTGTGPTTTTGTGPTTTPPTTTGTDSTTTPSTTTGTGPTTPTTPKTGQTTPATTTMATTTLTTTTSTTTRPPPPPPPTTRRPPPPPPRTTPPPPPACRKPDRCTSHGYCFPSTCFKHQCYRCKYKWFVGIFRTYHDCWNPQP